MKWTMNQSQYIYIIYQYLSKIFEGYLLKKDEWAKNVKHLLWMHQLSRQVFKTSCIRAICHCFVLEYWNMRVTLDLKGVTM